MALQAPLHLQRRFLPHERHLVDPPMARDTANAFLDVDAVIKVDKVRQVVDACPHDWSIAAKTRTYGFEHRARCPDLGMTGHTGLGRGQTGEGGLFDGRVTVPAVDTKATDVMFMAKGNGLRPDDACLRHVGRARDCRHEPQQRKQHKDSAKDTQPGNRVGTRMEYLRHEQTYASRLCAKPVHQTLSSIYCIRHHCQVFIVLRTY